MPCASPIFIQVHVDPAANCILHEGTGLRRQACTGLSARYHQHTDAVPMPVQSGSWYLHWVSLSSRQRASSIEASASAIFLTFFFLPWRYFARDQPMVQQCSDPPSARRKKRKQSVHKECFACKLASSACVYCEIL